MSGQDHAREAPEAAPLRPLPESGLKLHRVYRSLRHDYSYYYLHEPEHTEGGWLRDAGIDTGGYPHYRREQCEVCTAALDWSIWDD